MSEPTGDGKQQPDPAEDQVQDQTSGSDFGDPTAPVWVDPTAAVPAPPTPPGEAYPYGQQPAAAPQAVPQSPPPVNNPYAQQPYAQQTPVNNPYAQQPPAPPYGQQPSAYGQQYYATGASTVPSNTSAIILTIVAGLSTLTTCLIGIPSLIFGIMALTSNSTDPVGSRKKARTGWIVYGINAGVVVLLIVIGVVLLVVSGVNFDSQEFGNPSSGY